MIAFNRDPGLKSQANDPVKIRILGIGGAGANALDRLVLDGLESDGLVALNTDVQALTSSVAAKKIQLGRETTRGLGAGGDPEIGYAAAAEAEEEIRAAIEGAGMVFICAGLGGGTGSGAAPLVASMAREQGALVLAFATLPFSFEGRRRMQQAAEALATLQEAADIVICFENDKMGDAVSPKAGIHQAFAAADQTVSQSVRAIGSLFSRPGLIRIGFDDLVTALRNRNARCLFGYGEAEGDNRVHDALARALKNPLMDRGRMLADARNVLVHIAGGPSMTLNEVQILMDELGRHISDEAQILFGTAVDPKMGGRLSVTVISSIGDGQPAPMRRPAASQNAVPIREPVVEPEPEPEPVAEPVAAEQPEVFVYEPEPAPPGEETAVEPEPEAVETGQPAGMAPAASPAGAGEAPEAVEPRQESLLPVAPEIKPVPGPARPRRFVFPTLAKTDPAALPVAPPAKKPAAEPRQETLQFEPVTRGRFEKSEPTIVDGQDLDVPTFLRRNVKVK
jgi:cell division protein FtsZ